MRRLLLGARLVLAIGFWVSLAIGVLDTVNPGGPPWLQPPASFSPYGLLLIALASAVAYAVLSYRIHTSREASSGLGDDVSVVPTQAIDYFLDPLGKGALSFSGAMIFVDAVLYPKTVFERITESAEPWHRSVTLKTTYTIAVRSDDEPTDSPDFVLPLFLFPKGEVQDGLRVFDGDDRRISTLSTVDVAAYALSVVRALVLTCGRSAYNEYLERVEEAVMELVTSTRVPEDASVSRVIGLVENLPAIKPARDQLETVAELIAELAYFRPLCVTVPTTEVVSRQWPWIFRYRIEHRLIPAIRLGGRWPYRAADWLRLALGVRLNRLFVPLSNATRTNSYHLQVAGPEGTYLAHQEPQGLPDSESESVHLQPRRGQRRAHLYLRKLRRADVDAEFEVEFFERAPGSLASTTAAAWTAVVLVGSLALTRGLSVGGALPFDESSVLSTSAVLPALLALPVGIATWNRTGAQLHPSLLSRGLTFSIIVLSLATFIVSVTGLNSTTAFGATLWVSLVLLAAGLALLSTFSWVLRLAYEFTLARR